MYIFCQIVSFMTLHVLNLCTTLTPATALARYNTQTSIHTLSALGDPAPGSRKVDITNPSIANVLSSLAQVDVGTPIEIDTETDLVVKISPPIYMRAVPPTPPAAVSTTPTESGEMIDNFMSSWTQLVGDPVLSKWIVLVLAVSVALNGYLLKGIAAGGGSSMRPQGVRFKSIGGGGKREQQKKEEEAALIEMQKPAAPPLKEPVVVVEVPKRSSPPLAEQRHIPQMVAPIAIPATPSRASFILETVDEKLRQQAAADQRRKTSPSFSEASVTKETSSTRALEECIDVFENGPRPVSVALSMLNDEEVILLAQNGKIAAYALEKVLGDLERAVFIRRALICEFCFVVLFRL
jgi:hydroxymethylglutaryl-CoA reductase (NADPH)